MEFLLPEVKAPEGYGPWNHRMVWVGRDLKDHLVPTPVAMGRDTFH